MGRGKIEIKRIANTTNRQVTFSKRRTGLLKKANELAVLTDAQIAVIIISATGKLYQFHSPSGRMGEIIDEYRKFKNIRYEELNGDQFLPNNSQQLQYEIAKIRHESEMLQASIKKFTGEDLTGLTINDLNQLEDQLEFSVTQVRQRKHQLLHQQIENLRRKGHILADQNSCFYRAIMSEQQVGMEEQQAVELNRLSELGFIEPFGQFSDDSKSLLQLGPNMAPFQLQPTQPDLQQSELHGHGLQL